MPLIRRLLRFLIPEWVKLIIKKIYCLAIDLPWWFRRPLLSHPPVAYDSIENVCPLGNLNPSSHVFPTDHMYIYLKSPSFGEAPYVTNLYCPGDLSLVMASASEHVTAGFVDYDLIFKFCDKITLKLGHVRSLVGEIFGDVSFPEAWEYDDENKTWKKEYDVYVSAGKLLGTVGGNPGQLALDIGVYDFRKTNGTPANPSRWQEYKYYLHAFSVFDYYKATVFNQLLALLDREEIPGDEHPYGWVMQDIYGTAQGCWFKEGEPYPYPEDPHLALVWHNKRPSRAAFSVGTSIPSIPSGVYEVEIDTRESGRLNRPFWEITPDRNPIAYTPLVDDNRMILVQMPDEETLWIEGFDTQPPDPDRPQTYKFSIGTENKVVFKR